jgi:hypothetical protein
MSNDSKLCWCCRGYGPGLLPHPPRALRKPKTREQIEREAAELERIANEKRGHRAS